MKTFKDLIFKPMKRGGKQAIVEFNNCHKISVIGGFVGLFGDGFSTFEIWRSCDSDVKMYLTREEVTEYMIEFEII